jgi:SAM-dependent methyltransferase
MHPTIPFEKYEKGAYHWSHTYPSSFLRRSPRHHARYDLALKVLGRELDFRTSCGLDVGCGDGVLLYKVALLGGSIRGLDAEPMALELAAQEMQRRGMPPPTLFQASCLDIPLPAASVDYVTAIELIEHIAEVDAFMTEVCRVLRPGGWFVCTTPQRRPEQAYDEVRDPYHVHEFTASELRELLSGSFPKVRIFGGYPAHLDRIYVNGCGIPAMDKTLRLLFKLLSAVSNPYVRAIRKDPDAGWGQLIGLAQL